jgi:hypothetical protein
MTTARAAREAIALSGPPREVMAVVPLGMAGKAVVPLRLMLGGEPAIFRAHVRPFGQGASEIRLRLPEETPPGTYRGAGSFEGEERDVVVEVEPVLRLRVRPGRTALAGAAGATVPFSITVVNAGNVPIEVPKAAQFDLDDDEGQDLALGRTLRATLAEGERRVDRFFEEIRAQHGGEARVRVREGAGPLAAGVMRRLACELEIPATARAGRSYLGAWRLANAGHAIAVEVTKGGAPRFGR